jgi:hypothetical protein
MRRAALRSGSALSQVRSARILNEFLYKLSPQATRKEEEKEMLMKTANHNSTTLQSQSTRARRYRFGLALALAACICSLQLAASAKTLVAGPALTQIAAGSTQVWGLDAAGNVYHYSGGTFNLVPGANFKQIAVGLGTDVWGLGPKGHAFQWNASGKTFSEVSPTFVFASIATGKGGTWAMDLKGRIYYYSQVPNEFQLFKNPDGTKPPTATALYVGGAAEAVWILDNGTPRMPHLYNTITKFFDGVGTPLQQIAVGYNHVWGLDPSNDVREYVTKPTFEFQLVPSVLMTQLTITSDSELWAISDGNHAVYHYETVPKRFDLVDDSEDYVQITAGNSTIGVWAITNNHLIYKF